MKRLVLLGFAFLGVGSQAFAWGPGPNELVNDFHDLHLDRAAIHGDTHDLQRFESLLASYRVASWRRDFRWLSALESQFLTALRAEIRESFVEREQKSREAWHSSVELDRNVSYRGWRDDRNDYRDDRHDLFVESRNLHALKRLEARFLALTGHMRRWALAEKRGLIEQTIALARAELQSDLRELSEDRAELREDRGHLRPVQPVVIAPVSWRDGHTY